MKNTIKNSILAILIIANCQQAHCYTLNASEIKNEILKQIKPQIEDQLKEYSNEIEINIFGIPNQTIATNEQNKPKIEIISQDASFKPNSYKRILIKNSQNNTIKTFPINVQTKIWAQVLTSTQIIPFNSQINSENTKIEKKEISKYLGKTYSSQINGVITKRNYQKGSIIITDYNKAKTAILKNSNIDIVFQSKNLNIKLRGRALKDGSIGDVILVRSDKYNKTYTGTIKSENEVVVRI